MDRAIEILEAATDALEKEREEVLFNYRYDWMTLEQKQVLEVNIIREINDIREAISVLENS